MFRNEYQGGAIVEIFSAQGKDPVAKWKVSGGLSSISKVLDKEVKGFVYSLEGSSQTHRMQLPKDGKMPLVLIQRYLVLQVNVPLGKDFSTELVVTDQGHLKRRLYFSTVHKEFSATPLHARVPLTGLRRNTWCNLCIDLGSFTAELFRGAAFLSLDGIIISACCKVKRIFTLRAEPADHVDRDLYDMRNGPKEEIPRSCQFPHDVQHVTQLVNMESLRQLEVRNVPFNTESEQAGTGRLAHALGPKTQDSSHIAFGSKVTGRPPLTARRSSSSANGAQSRARTDPGTSILTGRSGNLQPRPPTERASSERTRSRRSPQIYSAGRESSVTRNNAGVPYPSQEIEESSQRVFQQLVQPVIEQDPSVDRCTPDQAWSSETPGPNPRPLRCQSPSAPLPRLCVLQNGINEASDTEPQLAVGETEDQDEEELFTFSSQPHSAKRGQHFCDPFLDLTSDFKGESLQGEGERKEARLEDDFIGSEDEEMPNCWRSGAVESTVGCLRHVLYERYSPIQRFAALSSPAPTTPPCAALQKSTSLSRLFTEAVQVQASGAAPVCVAPTRCLSPSTPRQRSRLEWSGAERSKPDGETRTSISRTSVREIPLGDLRLHKVRESERSVPVGSSRCDLHKRAEQEEDEEEELRMLASLRREQQEEADGTSSPGLSASQVDQCNVSLSMSSDDTSTWTQCIRLAAEQGQDYQKEMNPLLHSNPREWMDVLSPPIVYPSQSKEDNKKGSEARENGREDEFLSLLYDPCLNCYFDPQTGKYYELI
uniref:CFAP20 domain containing n=1 Tax=Astyanax mexicanus TaxID=7994 RepID=A0A3B1JSP1_ASTMX